MRQNVPAACLLKFLLEILEKLEHVVPTDRVGEYARWAVLPLSQSHRVLPAFHKHFQPPQQVLLTPKNPEVGALGQRRGDRDA